MKETTKAKIDAMTIDELQHQIDLGRASPYQRHKMAYIKSRYAQLIREEESQRHRENVAATKAAAESNKPVSPTIQIAITIIASITVIALVYIFRRHLGIPL